MCVCASGGYYSSLSRSLSRSLFFASSTSFLPPLFVGRTSRLALCSPTAAAELGASDLSANPTTNPPSHCKPLCQLGELTPCTLRPHVDHRTPNAYNEKTPGTIRKNRHTDALMRALASFECTVAQKPPRARALDREQALAPVLPPSIGLEIMSERGTLARQLSCSVRLIECCRSGVFFELDRERGHAWQGQMRESAGAIAMQWGVV